ncbi:MAG: DUF6541 family protein [Candidatus Buchananbacteria bacterium]
MRSNLKTRLIIGLVLIALSCVWKPILIFFVPGILILFLPIFTKIDLTDLLIYIFGISLSFWVGIFWFLKIIPLSLTALFWSVAIGTVVISIILALRQKKLDEILINKYQWLAITAFLFLAILRFLPLAFLIAPAYGDMGMHEYLSRLIVSADGLPQNYHPLLNIDSFNTYPVGWHSLSALVSLVGNLPSYRSDLILTGITTLAITLFLFVFLKKYVGLAAAGLTAIFFGVFIAIPQKLSDLMPTIMALAFFILFLSFFDQMRKNKILTSFSALALSAIFLSHTVVFIEIIYVFGAASLIYFFSQKEYKNYGWTNYLWLGFLSLLIVLPYLANFDYSLITKETSNQLLHIAQNKEIKWQDGSFNTLIQTGKYLLSYFGPLQAETKNNLFIAEPFYLFVAATITACLIGAITLFKKNKSLGIKFFSFFSMIVFLILNSRYPILPFSSLIWPERTLPLLLIPLSLFFALGLEKFLNYFQAEKTTQFFVQFILFASLIALAPTFTFAYYINPMIKSNLLTPSDFKAIQWLAENSGPSDVIQTNRLDAGLFIPALIFRPITNPHVDVLYKSKKNEATPKLKDAKYVYIGKKCRPNQICPLKNDDFKNNGQYQLVYSANGVFIYKIKKLEHN